LFVVLNLSIGIQSDDAESKFELVALLKEYDMSQLAAVEDELASDSDVEQLEDLDEDLEELRASDLAPDVKIEIFGCCVF
jgi:hypothetical protein